MAGMGHGNRPGRAGMGFKELREARLKELTPFVSLIFCWVFVTDKYSEEN